MPRAWTSSKWSWRFGQMPISAAGITPDTIKLVPLPEVIGSWGRRERAPDMYSIICRRGEARYEFLCKWIDKIRRQPTQ